MKVRSKEPTELGLPGAWRTLIRCSSSTYLITYKHCCQIWRILRQNITWKLSFSGLTAAQVQLLRPFELHPLLERPGGPLDVVMRPEAAQMESVKSQIWQHWLLTLLSFLWIWHTAKRSFYVIKNVFVKYMDICSYNTKMCVLKAI